MARWMNANMISADCCLAVLTVTLVVGCGKQPVPASRVKPALEMDEYEHDFGYCSPGEVLSHDFTFRNTGRDVLQLAVKKASCRCMASDLPKEWYQAGEQGTLHMKVETKGKVGPLVGSVLLESNDELNSQVVLNIKALVRGVALNPEAVFFGELPQAKKRHKQLMLTTYGLEDDAVRKITSSSSALQVSEPNVVYHGVGGSVGRHHVYHCVVSFDPAACVVGPFMGRIVLHTSNPQYSQIEVPVTAYVRGEVTAMPPTINFGVLRAGDKSRRQCRLRSNGTSSFSIDGVDGVNGSIACEIHPAIPSSEANLDLEFTASETEGLTEGTLLVRVGASGRRLTIAVPYTALVKR